MNKNRIIVAILSITILAGCATDPDKISSSYVSPLQYSEYSCKQIGLEMQRVTRRANELYGTLDKEASADRVQMGVGLILLWPTLLLLEGGDGPQAAEYARLKGERDALDIAAVQKECEPSVIPKIEAPKSVKSPPKRDALN